MCHCPEGTFLTRSLRSTRIVPKNGPPRPGPAVPRKIDGHDCDYVRARNALIPIAARRAYAVVVCEKTEPEAWAQAYYAAMTTLAIERLGATA